LGPLILAAALALDVGSRFVSYDSVCFRAWEALQRGASTGLGGQFEPNRRYENHRSYGDLSAMGNQPDMRQYRTEVFSTDAYGFRNTPQSAGQSPRVALVGTSFSAGAGLRDDETLSARLARELGQPVYNAAGAELGDDGQLTALIERLGLRDATIVSEFMEASPLPQLDPPNREARWSRLKRLLGDRYPPVRAGYARVRGWLSESPLKLTLFRGFKRLENDRVLPNSFARAIVRDHLVNGDPVLFLRDQLEGVQTDAQANIAVTYWKVLRERLARRGLKLLVVLVPSQYAVLGPLSAEHRPGPRRDVYLKTIRQGLEAGHVPVLDLTETLRDAARAGLARGQYVYWRDDTHWNAAGVALSARAIATRLRTASAADQTP
jgi:hypothetical protein